MYTNNNLIFIHYLVTEGVALLLMQKGLGLNAAKQALKWALFWGAITLISQSIVYTQDPTTSYITSITWQVYIMHVHSLLCYVECIM